MRTPMYFAFRHALFCVMGLVAVKPDWIDPDTPYDKRTTTRLNVQPYIWRPPQSSESTSSKQKKSTPTSSPSISPEPTVSPMPSRSPTMPPSQYPTYEPDVFELVFSDEFNTAGREFGDGKDPRWTALDKNDYTNDALHYYSPDNVKTENGTLVITSEAEDTEIIGFDDVKQMKTRDVKHFRSAMVQSWNKFCFTGGIIEVEATLPGDPNVAGLWPAFWLLGNLARHTYVGSSEHIWPWSSTQCTTKSRDAQRVSGCNRIAHFGMDAFLGRGAPEVDIFEVQAGGTRANQGAFLKSPVGQPFLSASFQVAPGRPTNRPGTGEWPGPGQWYRGTYGGKNTSLNILFYGNYNHFAADTSKNKDYWSDAISYNRQLNSSYFAEPHVFRLEWDVPTNTSDGYLHWFLDGEMVAVIDGKAVKDAGLGSEISTEPSYIILNTAISKQWGFPRDCPIDCKCKDFDCHSGEWQSLCGFPYGFCDMMKNDPPQYKVNWIRVYQDPNNPLHKVGCSTPERPTRRFIEGHPELYMLETDTTPLQPVPQGGGSCEFGEEALDSASTTTTTTTSSLLLLNCGGVQRGRCTKSKTCECMPGWTGPHCLAHSGQDPILYDEPDKISDLGFVPPRVVPLFLVVAMSGLLVVVAVALIWKRRFDGWTPIPDVELSAGARPGRGLLV